MTGPAGNTYAYEVTASAPYAGANNNMLTSAPAYVDFVANDTAGLAPYASSTTPFSASLGQSVPITVTLPPNSAGKPQANVLLTLSLTSGALQSGAFVANGATAQHASFVTSTGAVQGQTIQVTTNSSGVAQAYVSDPVAEEVQVAVSNLPSGVTAPSDTYLSFGQGGIASQVANYNITSHSVQAGQNVTVYGTLEDANGNPVPNGQIIVVGNDLASPATGLGSNASGDFGYVTTANNTSTVTDFPNVGSVVNSQISLSQGINATSSVGDVVTADSNGNFSFVITDTNDQEAATFSIYAVSNGQVASSTPLKSDTVTFGIGQTLAAISLAGTDGVADANTFTSFTGLSAPNHSGSQVWMDPQDSAANPLTNQNLTYNVSVNNGGTITALQTKEGSVLPINSSNPGLSAMTIDETYTAGAAQPYTFSVPGQSGSLTSASPDLGLTIYNGGTGSTVMTVSSGSATSTATVNFTGGVPSYVQSFSPVNSMLSSGQSQTVTFTVQDYKGNPVPANSTVTIASLDTTNPIWITAVNGVTLAQNENMGQTGTGNASYNSEPTPIPFGTAPSGTNLTPGYSSVTLPGVVSWTGSNIQAVTNSSGQVSLTLQAGGVNYYVAPSNSSTTYGEVVATPAVATSQASEYFYTYDNKGDSQNNPAGEQMAVGLIGSTYPTNFTQQLGSISFNTATSVPTASGTLTLNTSTLTVPGTLTVQSNTANVSGGTYALTSYTPLGGTATTTIPSQVTVNSSTGEVTSTSGAPAGAYTLSYQLNGFTEDSATFNIASASGVVAAAISPSTPYAAGMLGTATLDVTAGSTGAGTIDVTPPTGSQVAVTVGASDSAQTVANEIVTAFASNPTYTVTDAAGASTTVTFTQKTPTTWTSVAPTFALGTATGVAATGAVGTNGVAATPETGSLAISTGATNAGTLTVTIGGNITNTPVYVPVTAGATTAQVAADIYSALLGNSTVTGAYNLGLSGSSVTLQQKTASATTITATVTG